MVALDMQLEINESYTKWQPRARRLVDAGHAILDDSKRYGIYLEEPPKLQSISRTVVRRIGSVPIGAVTH